MRESRTVSSVSPVAVTNRNVREQAKPKGRGRRLPVDGQPAFETAVARAKQPTPAGSHL